MTMNWLDIILAFILVWSAVRGLMTGMVRVVIGFSATVIGLILACWFYGSAGSFVLGWVSSKAVANLLGFLAVYALVQIAGALIGQLVRMVFQKLGLSWLDRLLGFGFGFVRGMLVCTVIVLALLAFTPTPPPRSVVESRIAPYVIEAASACSRIAPRELTEGFNASYEKVKKIWSDAMQRGAEALPRQEL
jgi:membrane protein required for colicin V production